MGERLQFSLCRNWSLIASLKSEIGQGDKTQGTESICYTSSATSAAVKEIQAAE